MSLLLNGTTQYLERTASIPTLTFPFAVAAWVYPTSLTGDEVIVSFGDTVGNAESQQLLLVAGVPTARSRSASVNGDATATESLVASTWHHVLAIFISATEREVYIDGRVETRGTNATSLTPAGLDAYAVGRLIQLTPGSLFTGRVAEISVWNLSTTFAPSEFLSLAQGTSALQLRTSELIIHDKFLGQAPTIDMIGGFSLTATGAPTVADHPPIAQLGFQNTPFGVDTVIRVSQALTFGQTVVPGPNTFTRDISQQWDLFDFADNHIIILDVVQALTFGQSATTGPNVYDQDITQPWLINHTGRRTFSASVTQALTFGDAANRAGAGSNQLTFAQMLTAIKSTRGENALIFEQIATIQHAIRHLAAGNTLTFGQLAQTDDGPTGDCDLHDAGIDLNGAATGDLDDLNTEILAPAPAALVIRDTIEFFTLLGIPAPTLTIRNPSFGNGESHQKGNLFTRLRGGAPSSRHVTGKPRIRSLNFEVALLKDTDRDAIQVFLNATLGTKIRFTDHSSQVYVGIVTNPDVAISEVHNNQHTASFEMALSNDAAYVEV